MSELSSKSQLYSGTDSHVESNEQSSRISRVEDQLADMLAEIETATSNNKDLVRDLAMNFAEGISIVAVSTELVEDGANISFSLKLLGMSADECSFYIHWGEYTDSVTGRWIYEPVLISEITISATAGVLLKKRLTVDNIGRFGATVTAVRKLDGKVFWANGWGSDDAQFEVLEIRPRAQYVNQLRLRRAAESSYLSSIYAALESSEKFVAAVASAAKKESFAKHSFRKMLAAAIREDRSLRFQLETIREELKEQLTRSKLPGGKRRVIEAKSVIDRMGLGEVVLISPEGPQAAAGGLAQVVTGLARLMKKEDLPATVISFLYDQSAGHKHESAQTVLQHGIEFDGVRVVPKLKGTIRVQIAPLDSDTVERELSSQMIVHASVYEAVAGSVRLLLIHQPEYLRELYQSGEAQDWLKLAVFCSKAAYETMRSVDLNVSPDIILTNDWLTGLIPALIRTDRRPNLDNSLQRAKLVHVLHNAGRGYQGVFSTSEGGQDCWPIFNLSPEHYFGLSDPSNVSQINFSAAAIRHSDYVLTVSKNYAQQLLTRSDDEGLRQLLQEKRNSFFGISNGIDLKSIRRVIWRLGEESRKELGYKPLLLTRVTPEAVLRRLPSYKLASKKLVQRRYQLTEERSAVLCTLVGRLAEQKGISLLNDRDPVSGHSVLYRLLAEFPLLQLLIAGPLDYEDEEARSFADELTFLREHFPGRVSFKLHFVSHRESLEITQGSDMFLMPSRYEPGGITQLEALACGTPVIARRVGGLSATLADFSESQGRGNSFLFDDYTGKALYESWKRALRIWKTPKNRRILRHDSATAKNDWMDRKERYFGLLQYVAGVMDEERCPNFLINRRELVESCKP